MDTSDKIMEPQSQNLKTTPPLTLERFHISEEYGFLLPNPLVRIEAWSTFLKMLICVLICLVDVVIKKV